MEEMSSAFAVAFEHARVVFQFASLRFFYKHSCRCDVDVAFLFSIQDHFV